MMKRSTVFGSMAALILGAGAFSTVNAQDTATDDRLLPDWLSISANATFASGFVGNGITWVDGPVMMNSLTVAATYDQLTASVTGWTVMNLNDTIGYDNPSPREYGVTEYDIICDLTYKGLDYVDLSAGFIHYEFNAIGGSGSETSDVYGAVVLKTLPLTPKITYYYDVDGANSGSHGTVDGSHEFTVSEVSFVVFGGFGLADDSYGAAYFSDDGSDHAGFSHFWLGIKKGFEITPHFSITPSLTYSRLANDDGVLGAPYGGILDQAGNPIPGDVDNVVAAVSLDYKF